MTASARDQPDLSLEGAHALVTGAGRGIGRACALALARARATVTVVSRSQEDLESVVDEVAAAGSAAYAFAADVRDPEQVDAAVRSACEHGELSICVNSAGLNRTGPTHEYDVDDFDLVLETNLRGSEAGEAAGSLTSPRRWAPSGTLAGPPTARASTRSTA